MVYKLLLLTWTIVCALEYTRAVGLDDSALLLSNPVFQQLVERVNNLEALDKRHQSRISELESTDNIHKRRIAELESLDKIHQSRILELESRDHDQQQLIRDLEEFVRNQQQQMEEMELAILETSKTAAESIEAVVDHSGDVETGKANDNANRIRRQLPEVDVVAFTAILVHSQTDLGLNQNVHFDLIETNIGNAYNQHHGVFIAPIAGTYVFHISVLAQWNTEAWCKIVVNGINKVDAYAYGYASYSDQGSQMLVVHLNQGDDVAVQNGRAHNTVFGDYNSWTTFSGFLLHADTSSVNIIG